MFILIVADTRPSCMACFHSVFHSNYLTVRPTGTPPGEGNYTEKYSPVVIAASTAGGGAIIVLMVIIVIVTIVTRLLQPKLAMRRADQKIAHGYENMDKKVSKMYQNVVPEAINPSTDLVMKNLYLPEENIASAYDLADM